MADPAQTSKAFESDFNSFLFEGATQGISRAQASHLIPKTNWWDCLNMRFSRGKITQITSLSHYVTVGDGTDLGDVSVLTAVNVNATNAKLVCMTTQNFYEINPATRATTKVNTDPYALDASWSRWAVNTDATKMYFTNLANQIQQYIPGSGLSNLIASGPTYSGLYLENFHNHLMIANLFDGTNSFPNRIAYSDIQDFTDFDPTDVNEADFFELESQAGDALNGAMITGMAKMSDYLYIYTPTSIWQMQYVGLPNVMLTTAKIREVGCSYPYALASILDNHYFIGEGGFYRFDGATVSSIGENIWEYFQSDLHPHYLLQNKTFTIINTKNHEITWYYCSTTSNGTIDKAVVFNYIEQIWFPIDGRNVCSSQFNSIRQFTTIDQLTGTQINSLTGHIDALSANTPFALTLFGMGGSYITQEQDPTSTNYSQVLPETPAFLETGDIHYGSLGVVKELTSIRLDAAWLLGSGVTIELWGRYYIAELSDFPSTQWDENTNFGVGAIVNFNGFYWQRQMIASRALIIVTVVNGGSDYDFEGLVVATGGQIDTVRSTPYINHTSTFFLAGDAIDHTIPQADTTYWFQPPDIFQIVPPADLGDHAGSGATFAALMDNPKGPGVVPGEWLKLIPIVNEWYNLGTWLPDFVQAGSAGWVNVGNRQDVGANINRVHRWRFTFTGPTNNAGGFFGSALQSQQARFHSFEEKVYTSPSEL